MTHCWCREHNMWKVIIGTIITRDAGRTPVGNGVWEMECNGELSSVTGEEYQWLKRKKD